MKAFWNNLRNREQRLLLVGGLILLIAAGFLGVTEPLLDSREQSRERLAEARAELAWMQANASAAADAASRDRGPDQADQRSPVEGGSLIAHVDASARASGLGEHLARARPSETGVNVHLEAVPYSALMRWLGELELEDGVVPGRIMLERVADPGRVNAELFLTSEP
ncbi:MULTISPECIES: type II secretion system protein GspM [unclassified Thioalkalivibrio]|uniref:type II secretion system protein GspM n=1 Tax=unclassified Thioalkalivibrio TaxID=2621013 RepID=UPI0003759CD8|nr:MULTISPECIES: type II secretion system protein GspM [unclassified Thioalkalivibrio]